MKNFLLKISLKNMFFLFSFGTVLLLSIVIFSAGKQYLLYQKCGKTVNISQQLLFRFSTINGHINGAIMRNSALDSKDLIMEIEEISGSVTGIRHNVLIPEDLKSTFISEENLVKLSVAIRNSQRPDPASPPGQRLKLVEQLNDIQARLSSFHHDINRYTQKQLLDLHRLIAGLLAVVISMVTVMLLMLNRYITSPIIRYCRTKFPEDEDRISLGLLHSHIKELANGSTNTGRQTQANVREHIQLYRQSSVGKLLGGISNDLTNGVNGILNYTQAIIDLTGDSSSDKDSEMLLKKLLNEEKRVSKLLSEMISFTITSENATPKSQSCRQVFRSIEKLVEPGLRNGNISINIILENPELNLNYHVSDLQLVVLSALQNSKTALLSAAKGQTQHNWIEISQNVDLESGDKLIIVIKDNGSPWQSMFFCNEFIQTFGGALKITRDSGNTNLCIISVPIHNDQ